MMYPGIYFHVDLVMIGVAEMRATVTIRDSIAKDLFRLAEQNTKTAAINHALADWVRLKKIQQLRNLRGKLDVANDLDKLRQMDVEGV